LCTLFGAISISLLVDAEARSTLALVGSVQLVFTAIYMFIWATFLGPFTNVSTDHFGAKKHNF
jgi:hypothetical protein